jgi:nicotinate-nucleotide adenylyltransferase
VKLGLFGGSFDPIHWGHIRPIRQALEEVPLDEVLYLPTADPPHKRGRAQVRAPARFAMVEMALLEYDALRVTDHELTPGQVAYTVETVEHYRRRRPDDRIHLIVGADSFVNLHRWHRWQDLVEMVELVVLRRRGWSLRDLPDDAPTELLNLLARSTTHVVGSDQDVSSTEVRESLRSGAPTPEELVPETVLRYIKKYALYGPES